MSLKEDKKRLKRKQKYLEELEEMKRHEALLDARSAMLSTSINRDRQASEAFLDKFRNEEQKEEAAIKKLNQIKIIIDNIKHQEADPFTKKTVLELNRDALLELKFKLPESKMSEVNVLLDKISSELKGPVPEKRCKFCGIKLSGNETKCPNCGGIV